MLFSISISANSPIELKNHLERLVLTYQYLFELTEESPAHVDFKGKRVISVSVNNNIDNGQDKVYF